MTKQKYHANGKPITRDFSNKKAKENPVGQKRCPKCKSGNTVKSGNVRDCLACKNLFY